MYIDGAWIRRGILESYPDIEKGGGVDFDGDGIEEDERFGDLDQNGVSGDLGDYRIFYQNNKATIDGASRYFALRSSFSVDNILHEILDIDSELAPKSHVDNAYAVVAKVLSRVRKKLEESEDLTPKEKLRLVYHAMQEEGFEFKVLDGKLFSGAYHTIFTDNVLWRITDCDTSSIVALTVAHELGWPVRAVDVPEHAFVRWDDGETRFNMDISNGAKIWSDDFYKGYFDIDDEDIAERGWLTNMSREEFIGVYLMAGRASAKARTGRKLSALKDTMLAVKLTNGRFDFYEGLMQALMADRTEINLGYRISPVGDVQMDSRLSLALTWALGSLSAYGGISPGNYFGDINYWGLHAEAGYATAGDHHNIDFSLGFVPYGSRSKTFSVVWDISAGYNILAGGDGDRSPLPEGAFLQYGWSMTGRVAKQVWLGLEIAAMHQFDDFEDVCLTLSATLSIPAL